MNADIESLKHWNSRYKEGRDSGGGSYGDIVFAKLKAMKTHILPEDVSSIFDLGCGDFSFGSRVSEMFPSAKYTAVDQSSVVIGRNIRIYNSKFNFKIQDNINEDADLVLCVDVLFHVLREEKYNEILHGLIKHWKKYLVISAFDRDGETLENGKIVITKLDESLFGKPIEKFLIEPDGANFYIFKK